MIQITRFGGDINNNNILIFMCFAFVVNFAFYLVIYLNLFFSFDCLWLLPLYLHTSVFPLIPSGCSHRTRESSSVTTVVETTIWYYVVKLSPSKVKHKGNKMVTRIHLFNNRQINEELNIKLSTIYKAIFK